MTQQSDSTEEGAQQVARKASHDARKTPSWTLPPKPLRFLIIILLVLGIFFRFANLDRKVYWFDEVFTSKWISGYTEKEVVQQVYDGGVIGVEDLQKYQRLSPEKGLSDTINALAAWPENPPLYYLMARFWMQLFRDSVTTPRGLSAVSSLLVFPGVYWLCLELFGTPLMGWMAIAPITRASPTINPSNPKPPRSNSFKTSSDSVAGPLCYSSCSRQSPTRCSSLPVLLHEN